MEQFLSNEWYKKPFPPSGKHVVYVLRIPKNSSLPRLTLSQTMDNVWHLTVEVSFPSWLRDSNIILANIEEIIYCLELLSIYVEEKSGLQFDAFTSQVCRADVTQDIHVGVENIGRIMRTLSNTKLNGFDRTTINNESVYFENIGKLKTFIILVYDKYKQSVKAYPDSSDLDLACRILRCEVRFRTVQIKRIARNLGLPDCSALQILQPRVAEEIWYEGSKKIHLDLLLEQPDDPIRKLIQRVPITKAIPIVGFINLIQRFGNNFHENPDLNFNKRTFQRYSKKCLDNKINPYE